MNISFLPCLSPSSLSSFFAFLILFSTSHLHPLPLLWPWGPYIYLPSLIFICSFMSQRHLEVTKPSGDTMSLFIIHFNIKSSIFQLFSSGNIFDSPLFSQLFHHLESRPLSFTVSYCLLYHILYIYCFNNAIFLKNTKIIPLSCVNLQWLPF